MNCPCCGSSQFQGGAVLWPELIAEWRIAPYEVDYINRQQAFCCTRCGANLRSMALARAILRSFGSTDNFQAWVGGAAARRLRVLEVNGACHLTQFLRRLPEHTLVNYPEVDLMALPYPDRSFDLVIHSDTLEHVPRPVRGLSECRRVLKPGGFCAFTIPIIVDRLTASREGLPPSYHGSSANPADHLVHTEYGADAWKHVVQAGFEDCRLFAFDYPAALALVGTRGAA
jgi:SAM-dependent methyltransferase